MSATQAGGGASAWAPAIAAAAVAAISVRAAPGLTGWAGAGLGLLMLAIAAEDVRALRIPDRLNLAAAALGLAQTMASAPGAALPAALDAALRGGAMALAFLAVRLGFRRMRGREGLGLGDVKLAGVAGLWLDWPYLPPMVEIAALGGLALALILRLRQPALKLPDLKLPFGALLAPALWLSWLMQSCAGLFLN